MFRFGNRNKPKRYNKRYSIGEKFNYFYSILNDSNTSFKKKRWANNRIKSLHKIRDNIKQGDVFIVHDRLFGNNSGKPRYAVVAKTNGNKVDLLPVRKSDEYIILSLFDNQRYVSIDNSKNVHKNGLYEIRGFRGSNNARLTSREKVILEKKAKIYLP